MSELLVDTRDLEGVVLLYPRGFLNAHTVRMFESELHKAMERRALNIVVSCGGLRYIASAGLGALMGVIDEVRANGGDIRLADLNETVRNIFEILGFDHLYRIFPSEGEAVLSFQQEREAGAPEA